MPIRCAAYNCDNTGLSRGVSFFSFPSDEERRAKWIRALGKPSDWQPPITLRVCALHFTPECLYPTNIPNKKRRLKRNAIPSIVDPRVFKTARFNEITEANVTEAACLFEVIWNPTTSSAVECSNEPYSEENLEIVAALCDREVGIRSSFFHTYSATKIKTKSQSTQTKSFVANKFTQTVPIRGVNQGTQCILSSRVASCDEKAKSNKATLGFSYSDQSSSSQSSDTEQSDESSSQMLESQSSLTTDTQQSQPISLETDCERRNLDSSYDPSGSQRENELDSSDSESDEYF